MIKVSVILRKGKLRSHICDLLEENMGFDLLVCDDKIHPGSVYYGDILIAKQRRKTKEISRKKIQKLRYIVPGLKVLMLLKEPSDELILAAIASGADGYLSQKVSDRNLLEALQECYDGGCPITSEIAQRVVLHVKKMLPEKHEDYDLTKREFQILHLLVEGLDTNTIANKLFISIQTVRNHLKHIYVKLHVHSKSQAVVKAIRKGLVI